MDFLNITKLLQERKNWWIDAVFYLAITLVIAVIFSYIIFSVKISFDKKAIDKQTLVLATIGTDEQKNQEQQVLTYIQKMNDFNDLLKNHRFSSNVFKFLQDDTMPYIWFSQFALDQKNNSVQLFGEADNVENLSRQVINFENSEYVEKINLLNSKLGLLGKVAFNLNITLKPNIFDYIADQQKIEANQEKNASENPSVAGQ